MFKIHNLKIYNNEAEGIVYADQLTDKQLKQLGMSSIEDGEGWCFEVYASVDYSVQWHNDIPMVTIEEVTLSYGNKYLTLNDKEYDYDDLSIKLEQDGPYLLWLKDKEEVEEDYYYNYDN